MTQGSVTETEMDPGLITDVSTRSDTDAGLLKTEPKAQKCDSSLGSDRMASTRVVRAHSRSRQADCGGSALMMQ